MVTSRAIMAGVWVLQLVLVVLDVTIGTPASPFTTAYVIPVLILATVAGPRAVAIFGLIAIALAVASGAGHGFLGEGRHVVRLAVVGAGVAIAILGAAGRARLLDEVRRLGLLRRAADAVAPERASDATAAAAALLEVLVPAVTVAGVVELAGQGVVASAGPPEAVAEARGALEHRRADRPEVAVLALTAPDGEVGRLALRWRRPPRADETRFAAVLADRAGLALGHARLVSGMLVKERELAGILEGLADAVHVHDAEGQTVYANAAAARLMGLPGPQTALAARPGELAARFEILDEAGDPIPVERFPGRRLFLGERDPEPLLTHSLNRETGEEKWTVTKATAIRDEAGEPVLAVNVVEDVTEATQSERTARLLAEAGELLGASLEPQEALQGLARTLAGRLADWSAVDVVTGNQIDLIAVAHADPRREPSGRELRERYPVAADEEAGLAAVLRGGPTFLMQDITDADLAAYARDAEHLRLQRGVGFGHVLVVGMRAGAAGTLGALTLVRGVGRPRFTPAEVALVEEIAGRASTALLNARLYRERGEVAETLQRALLPSALPEVAGLRMAAHYQPTGLARTVGGDFYDAHHLPSGLLVLVGDVTGKGPAAAALTGLARAAFEAVATLTGTATAALSHLDLLLARRGDLALCSLACVGLHAGEEDIVARVQRAGHPAPLLVRDGTVSELGRPGPLLGAFLGGRWDAEDTALRDGDVVVLVTDGVTDAVGADERFGDARLQAALRRVDPGDAFGAVAAVRDALEGFVVGPARDDVAVVALAVTDLAQLREGIARTQDGLTRLASSQLELTLESTPASVRHARDAVVGLARGRMDGERADRIRLLVSEVASNAVRHAGGARYEVRAELDAVRLRVEVIDLGPGLAGRTRREADGPPDGGYGLGIVDRLSDRWGADRQDGRSRVWFELVREPVVSRPAG